MNMKASSSDEERFRAVWSSCNIPPRLAGTSLDGYRPTCTEQEKALAKCRTFSTAGMANILQGKGLFLQGPVGTGKSHLAVATLREILIENIEQFGSPQNDYSIIGEPEYNGLNCIAVSVVNLLGLLRDSYSADQLRGPTRRLLRRARNDALVILDDIGAEKPSDWVEEQLYALIDLRYRMQRATLFTTNCTLKQLESQIGSRVVSRIFEMCEGVKVGGADWRKCRNL